MPDHLWFIPVSAGVGTFDVKTRKRLGRIPTGWYPTDVIASADRLLILDSKGRGTTPNPNAAHPGRRQDSTLARSFPLSISSVVSAMMRVFVVQETFPACFG